MTLSVLLNNVTHRDLCVVTERGAAWGDDVMSVVVFADEFRNLQAHYPLVFQKTADGTGFQPIAVLGFEPGQNLFLGPSGWDASYVPIAIERQPFLIGVDGDELLVHVDMDSPRVGTARGEPVFLPQGGTTDYLARVNSLLRAVHEGVQATPAFVRALLEHELLESFVLDAEGPDGLPARLAGLYTIDEERLARLPGAALQALNAAGHLLPIYMAVASIGRFRDLIERRARRTAQA
ncbi:MAG: peptidase [Leptothrix sp. (in: Bacteria)]|nr:peptidase [Leptothrix sp. (in: b-proteobacteria)]